MSLKECIVEIVKGFKVGEYFDSHTVINKLISDKKYHLQYLRGYSDKTTVAQYHGQISQSIEKLGNCELISKKCKTSTIYGDLSANALWKKKGDN